MRSFIQSFVTIHVSDVSDVSLGIDQFFIENKEVFSVSWDYFFQSFTE